VVAAAESDQLTMRIGQQERSSSVRKIEFDTEVVQAKELLSLDEIPLLGGPSKATLRREIAKGNLRAVYLADRCVRVLRADWTAYVANNRM
jgi:hypothetical protein